MSLSEKENVEEIDWTKYLLEGIPKWPPQTQESFDDSSDSLHSTTTDDGEGEDESQNVKLELKKDDVDVSASNDVMIDVETTEKRLKANIQHTWFNQEHVRMLPVSDLPEANIAVLWEKHLDAQIYGLIPLPKASIISEYKVLREILWELYNVHENCTFKFERDRLIVNPELTIASVRSEAFNWFVTVEFLPYIELMRCFTEFNTLMTEYTSETEPCVTYKCYNEAIKTILKPVYNQLIQIEMSVKAQETTWTLIKLATELKPIFTPVKALKKIHDRVICNHLQTPPLECALSLLVKLHDGFLLHTASKLDQDIYFTLYLESLYKYVTISDHLLTQDVIVDPFEEYPICDISPTLSFKRDLTADSSLIQETSAAEYHTQDWKMQLVLQTIDDSYKSDSFIGVISNAVLAIAKNIRLLNLLKKLPNFSECSGTLYGEFIEKVLQEIANYSGNEETCTSVAESVIANSDYPIVCPDDCKTFTEFDKLENLIDTSDEFLMKAFESYFKPTPKPKIKEKQSLYKRITQITVGLCPLQHVAENALSEILHKRYSHTGLAVKQLLLAECQLEKQFELLKHLFLFKDDFMFHFYRRLFRQIDKSKQWGNIVWLSSHLQDLIVDCYPDFYKRCTVHVDDNWQHCDNSLKACSMVNLRYEVKWPFNVIIRNEHLDVYNETFKFLINVKWALYTLNHLYFKDLRSKEQVKIIKIVKGKLNILRFHLLSVFSNIQHYIFGIIFHMLSAKFEKEVEKSYDINSLIEAHGNFIKSIHENYILYKDHTDFNTLLELVRRLQLLWRNLKVVNLEELDSMLMLCKDCVASFDNFVIPTEIFYAMILS